MALHHKPGRLPIAMKQNDPSYLIPYRRAVERFGGTFSALLWASPRTQAMRFDAARRMVDFEAKIIADIGCGRADLLDHLLDRGIRPAHYIGIEAVDAMVEAAEHKHHNNCTIVRADVVKEPRRLFVGADVVIFSGSLNTMDEQTCHRTLAHAFRAATHTLVFNFLDSPELAGEQYLTWHRREEMLTFARGLGGDATMLHDYLSGDCTMRVDRAADRLDEFDEPIAQVLEARRTGNGTSSKIPFGMGNVLSMLKKGLNS